MPRDQRSPAIERLEPQPRRQLAENLVDYLTIVCGKNLTKAVSLFLFFGFSSFQKGFYIWCCCFLFMFFWCFYVILPLFLRVFMVFHSGTSAVFPRTQRFHARRGDLDYRENGQWWSPFGAGKRGCLGGWWCSGLRPRTFGEDFRFFVNSPMGFWKWRKDGLGWIERFGNFFWKILGLVQDDSLWSFLPKRVDKDRRDASSGLPREGSAWALEGVHCRHLLPALSEEVGSQQLVAHRCGFLWPARSNNLYSNLHPQQWFLFRTGAFRWLIYPSSLNDRFVNS